MREIYQMPGVADSVDLDHIRHHYQRSHPTINKFGIVAITADSTLADEHDRARFPVDA
jgi:putative glutathione S-transferase